MPDFSTLCRRQRTLSVAIPYKGSAGPLNLLIDSTGIKAEGEGEWNARKHGESKRRLWRKIHIGIDERTLEIRAIEVTSRGIGDTPMLPDLLSQIPPDQELGRVTADGVTRRLDAARKRATIHLLRKMQLVDVIATHLVADGAVDAATLADLLATSERSSGSLSNG